MLRRAGRGIQNLARRIFGRNRQRQPARTTGGRQG